MNFEFAKGQFLVDGEPLQKGGPGSGPQGGNKRDAQGAADAARSLADQYKGTYQSSTPGRMAAVNATRDASSKSNVIANNGEHSFMHGTKQINNTHEAAAKAHDKAARLNDKVGSSAIAAGHREIAEVHRSLVG